MKSETTIEITKAIVEVMKSVKGIDKTMTIGTGNSSYKGVPDQDVKKTIGDAMAANGLAIVPIEVNESSEVSQWDEMDNYSKMKRKQSIFTKVTTKYLLLHNSGEFITLAGFGHGVDNQDKGAGKATTYALKYALLYTFLVPTGKIDDADNTHSNDLPIKPAQDLNEAMVEMMGTSTIDGVKSVWVKYRSLQANEGFIKLKEEKKNEFSD